MPTMHLISSDMMLRKHGLDHLPWEGTDNSTGSNSNKKAKLTTTDGAIRQEEHNAIARAIPDSRAQPPYKTTGMDSINKDEGGNSCVVTRYSSLPRKSFEPKVNSFFDRVDELKAYKEKHGHLNVSHKDNQSLYGFSSNLRGTRRAIITGKGKINYSLDGDRIAALDAIGFEWELGVRGSSTPASNNDIFFARVEELKAYKETHGHLNVHWKDDDKSLYNFSRNLRSTRRAILTGEGRIQYLLDNSRIAALDAIGFDWKLRDGGSSTATSKDDILLFDRVKDLKAYKEKHGHLIVRSKDDSSLYNFCNNMRQARKGKGLYRLDETRIAALDAIGFNWDPQGLKMSSTSPCAMTSKSTQQATKPWEGTDNSTRSNSNKKAKLTTTDGAIRQEEQNAIARAIPDKTTGMDSINKDEGGNYCVATRYSSLRRKSSKPKVNSFFDQVEKLRAYKEKHGHFNVRWKDDSNLYTFCSNVRTAQRNVMSGIGTRYKLTEDRIAALAAIGFDWKLRDGVSSTAASKDDKFFAQVDKLRAYKEKHGHLNVRKKEDKRSLYDFSRNLRYARKGNGPYRLDETRIAALDAIGFNWDPLELKMSSTSPSAMTSKSTQQATNPKINVGDVGYQFLKEFHSGWYNGTVIEILQDADDGWDRRCIYEDGDCEDLTLNELIRLATLSSREHVGTIEVVGDVESIDGGSVILAAKENPVIQKAARLKHQPLSKTMTSSTDDLFLTKNSKSPSNNNKAMAMELASLSSVDYDDLTLRELKRLPALAPHVVAIEKLLRSMRTVEDDGVKRLPPSEGMPI